MSKGAKRMKSFLDMARAILPAVLLLIIPIIILLALGKISSDLTDIRLALGEILADMKILVYQLGG